MLSATQASNSRFWPVPSTADQQPPRSFGSKRITCCVPREPPFVSRLSVRLTRNDRPSRRKSNSTVRPSLSLLISSTACWPPPRGGPKREYVTASKTDDLPLPLRPESIHSEAPSKVTSCSSV